MLSLSLGTNTILTIQHTNAPKLCNPESDHEGVMQEMVVQHRQRTPETAKEEMESKQENKI